MNSKLLKIKAGKKVRRRLKKSLMTFLLQVTQTEKPSRFIYRFITLDVSIVLEQINICYHIEQKIKIKNRQSTTSLFLVFFDFFFF